MNSFARQKADLEKLIVQGERLWLAFDADQKDETEILAMAPELRDFVRSLKGAFSREYQEWFTLSCAVIRQLLPARLDEFLSYYHVDPKRKVADNQNFKIQDWVTGRRAVVDRGNIKRFEDTSIIRNLIWTQLLILKTCKTRFDSSLHELHSIVQAELFASELDAARDLLKKGFLRAAGAICGVVLEAHLQQVAETRKVAIAKKHPTISDLNDPLRNAGVYDVPVWRHLQRLADIRNLCDHKKDREPTADEVTDLIDGTDKVTKTVN